MILKNYSTAIVLFFLFVAGIHTNAAVTEVAPFTERQVWDGPYEIKMIASPILEPVYVNPIAAQSDIVQADSLILCETILHTGTLLDINNRYQGWPPREVRIPLSTIFCPEGTEPCPQGYEIDTTSDCPNGEYDNILYSEKLVYLSYADYDNDMSTFSSSRASYSTSGCNVQIETAYLYWFGQRKQSSDDDLQIYSPTPSYNGSGDVARVNPSTFQTVKFKAPGSAGYTDVSAIDTYDAGNNDLYICVADVTNLLQGQAAGDVWVANVQSYLGRSSGGSFSGWTLVLVYSSPMAAPRRISLWDGLMHIEDASSTIELTGLQTPSTSNFKSYIGYACLDGENFGARVDDPEYLTFATNNGGVDIQINPYEELPYPAFTNRGEPANASGSAMTDGCDVPDFSRQAMIYDGVSSSHISTYDEVLQTNGNEIDRTPSCSNTIGVDVHHLLLPENSIATGATQASLTFESGEQGGTSPFLSYIAIETLQPKLEVTKSADVNYAELEQIVNFSIWVKNTGGLASLGSSNDFIIDTLDAGIDYVPSSCNIAGTVLQVGSPNVLQVPLPVVAVGDSLEVTFSAVIKDISFDELWVDECKREIVNVAWSQYEVPDGRIFRNISNASDCVFGSATRIRIQDESLGAEQTDTIGPIEISTLTDLNIIGNVNDVLIAEGVSPAELDEFTIYYSENFNRVHPDSSISTSVPFQQYKAIRTVGSIGQCEEIYVIQFILQQTPQFVQDTINVSCFGLSDGAISVTANFDSGTGQLEYYFVEGTIATEDELNAAIIIAEQAMSSNLSFTVDQLVEGDYSIVARDNIGNMYFLHYTIFEPLEIVTSIRSYPQCEGNPVPVELDVLSGRNIDEVSYHWESSTDNIVWNTMSGTSDSIAEIISDTTYYRLIVSDTVCSDTAYAEAYTFPIPYVQLGNDTSICAYNNLILDAGSNADNYLWNDASVGRMLSVDATGVYMVTVSQNGCVASDSISVLIIEQPILTIATQPQFCDSGVVAITETFEQYIWSTGSESDSIGVTQSGQYYITVTDSGCVGIDSVDVIVNQTPVFDLGDDTLICEQDSFLISGPESMDTYMWTNFANSQSIFVNSSGTYYLTVSKDNCSYVDSLVVGQIPLPEVDLGDDTSFCQHGDIQSAIAADSYLWNTGDVGQTLSVGESGMYSLQATTNGCSTIDTLYVTIDTIPIFSLGLDSVLCQGEQIVLEAGANADSYLWNTGYQTETIIVETTGEYSVVLTSGTCDYSDTINIEFNALPQISFTGVTAICEGDSAIIELLGADSFEWNNTLIGARLAVLPDISGVYPIRGYVNECFADTVINIRVKPLPELNTTLNHTICFGDTTSLSVSGNFDAIEWSHSLGTAASVNVSPTETTKYYLSGELAGCIAEDSVEVAVNPEIIISPGQDTSICIGSSVQLIASGNALSYEWDNGLGTSPSHEVTPLVSTQYKVTAFFNGCESVDSVSITVNELPVVTASVSSPSICVGDSVMLLAEGAENYLWSDGDSVNHFDAPLANQTYALTGTDVNGCVNTVVTEVVVNVLPEITISKNVTGESSCEGQAVILDAGNFETYEWNTSETTSLIQLSDTGSYSISVTVTDINGCVNSDSTIHTIYAYPQFDLGNDTLLCINQDWEYQSNIANATYLWYNGHTGSQLSVYPPGGTVWGEVTVNGCSSVDSVTVNFTNLPDYEILGDTVIYEGDTAWFMVSSEFASYMWNTMERTRSIRMVHNVANPSDIDYWVMVTDEYSCQQGDTVTLSIVVPPQLTLSDLEFCEGQQQLVHANAGFDTYEWSTGEITQSISVANSGVVWVRATKYFPPLTMYDTISVTVNPLPEFDLGNDRTVCEGEEVLLRSQVTGSHLWNTGSHNTYITVSDPGTYMLTVNDVNGCEYSDSIHVLVTPTPQQIGDKDYIFCVNTGVQELTVLGQNVQWYADTLDYALSNSDIIDYETDIATEETYYVSQTVDGCVSEFSEVNVKVVSPAYDISIEGDTTLCVPQYKMLYYTNAEHPVSWILSDDRVVYSPDASIENINVDFNSPGVDTIVATTVDGNGCEVTDTLIVKIADKPSVDFSSSVNTGNSTIRFYNESSLYNIPETDIYLENQYRWNFGKNDSVENVSTDTTIAYDYGGYTIKLYAENEFGCRDSIEKKVFIDVHTGIFVPNAFAPDYFATDVSIFRPTATNLRKYKIQVFDCWGNLLWFSDKLSHGEPAEGWDATYNGVKLKSDTYVWRIDAEFNNGRKWKEYGNVVLVR